MKIDQLIQTLSVDAAPKGPSLQARYWLALAIGSLISFGLFIALIGPRGDIQEAIGTLAFDLKFVVTAALLLPSALLALRLLRPEAKPGQLALALAVPAAILVVAVGVELATTPSALWAIKLVGQNSMHCLKAIPLLAMAPLAALIYVMRGGAPSSPTLTGAMAGAAAAGIAATLYASNCPDDSPLFVATWYPLATAIVVAIGALAGNRFLRW